MNQQRMGQFPDRDAKEVGKKGLLSGKTQIEQTKTPHQTWLLSFARDSLQANACEQGLTVFCFNVAMCLANSQDGASWDHFGEVDE